MFNAFGAVPTAVWIGWICSIAIPYVSALLTAHPSHLTGWITTFLAGAVGVLSTLAATGDVTWKSAGAALVAWIIAGPLTHKGNLAATSAEADLHTHGAQLGKNAP